MLPGTITAYHAPVTGQHRPQPGPLACRIVLGQRLKQTWEAAGLTAKDIAIYLDHSQGRTQRTSQWLSGQRTPTRPELRAVLSYCATQLTPPGGNPPEWFTTEQAGLLKLHEGVDKPIWTRAYNIPYWLEVYIALEQAAHRIRTIQLLMMPGLFQTEDYALWTFHTHPEIGTDPAAIERRLEVRLTRQRRLTEPADPAGRLHMDVLLHAASLYACTDFPAGPGQLRHLLELSELPNIRIRVLKRDTPPDPAFAGPSSVMELGDWADDAGYQEGIRGGDVVWGPDVAAMATMHDRVRASGNALTPKGSRDFITNLL